MKDGTCRCRKLGGGSGASSSGRQLQSTVLGSYKAELREFRSLQQELEPWVEAFKEQHARKPMLADVHATREAPTSHHACMSGGVCQQPVTPALSSAVL